MIDDTVPSRSVHGAGAAFGEYEFDDDPARIDQDAVWDFMTDQAYWGKWRTRALVRRQIADSWRVVGAYHLPTNQMVGFARAFSDGVSAAYLADVYLLPEHRGRGLGAQLIVTMIERGPGVAFRWMLHTGDAHGFYAKLGFTSPDHTYLERAGNGSVR